MITREILIKLMENYDDILKRAESVGYHNLRIYYRYGCKEKDILHFVGKYYDSDEIDPNAWKRNLDEEFKAILGIEVSFLGEGAPAITCANFAEEAEKAPLSDMHK